jgi:DnaJ family protein A protein 2
MDDYYNILGLEKNASQSDIKKAFYKLAKEHHPDRGGAQEKFKACNEAYEVLSDPEKRASYDRFGKQGQQFEPHFDFNQFNPFGFNRQPNRTSDINIDIEVSLHDLYHGSTITHSYDRTVICKECSGKGTSKDINTTCPDCLGKKQKINMVRQGNAVYQTVSPCQTCQGKGVKIKDNDKCNRCTGTRTIQEHKTINIEIEKGMFWDHIIKMHGYANEQPEMLTGDLLVTLSEPSKDEYLKRINDDLVYHLSINLLQALGGKEITLKHLNGDSLTFVGDLISPGDIKILPGHGMPIQYSGNYGDLYIKFQVILRDLQESDINNIIKILNPDLTEKLKGLSLDSVKELPKINTHEPEYEHTTHNTQQCTQQ